MCVEIWRTIFTNPFLFAELFSFQKLFCLKKKREKEIVLLRRLRSSACLFDSHQTLIVYDSKSKRNQEVRFKGFWKEFALTCCNYFI